MFLFRFRLVSCPSASNIPNDVYELVLQQSQVRELVLRRKACAESDIVTKPNRLRITESQTHNDRDDPVPCTTRRRGVTKMDRGDPNDSTFALSRGELDPLA